MATQEFGVRVVALGVGEFRRSIQSATSDMNNFNRTISSATGTAATLGPALSRVGGAITGLGRSITIGVTAPLIALLGTLVNLGMNFEDAFAGVTKTVDGLAIGFDEIAAAAQSELGIVITNMDEAKRAAQEMGMAFGDLTPLGESVRQQFRDLGAELPMPISKLAELGETIGQLGVGADKIAEVTKLISYLGIATDLSAEDAANGLIRFKNILMGTAGDIEDFVRRAGSALVELGNASVSTEGEILSLSLRIAAAGDRAKMTAPEILAWATTLSDLGVRAEAGGTAVSRAITEIVFAIQSGSENIATFASVTGDSVDEFSRKFSEDASGALAEFVAALELGIRTGRVTKDMLAEMGLSGVRSIDIMGRLGDAMDIFSGNLTTANRGWEEQVALQEEAEKRFATLRSQVQLAKNAFTDLGITVFDLVRDDLVALVESIKRILGGFKKIPQPVQEAIIKFGLVALAIGPILVIVGLVISAIGTLITVLGALASPLGLAAGAVGVLGAAFVTHLGSDKVNLIQPMIDKVQELADILFGMGDAPAAVAPSVQFGEMPFLPEDQMFLSDVAPEPEDIGMSERFVAVLAEIKETLLGLIPPETLASLKNFIAAVGTAGTFFVMTFNAIADTVKTTLGPTFTETLNQLTELLASFGLDWEDVWKGVISAITIVAIVIGGIILIIIGVIIGLINAVGTMLATWNGIWSSAIETVKFFVDGFTTMMTGFLQILQGVIIFVMGFFATLVGIFTDNQSLMDEGWQAMGSGIKDVWDGIVNLIIGAAQTIIATMLIIMNGVGLVLGTIISLVLGFGAGILGFFGQMWAQLTGDTDNALLRISEAWNNAAATVTEFVKGLIDEVTGSFKQLFDDLIGHSIIIDMVNAIIEKIAELKDSFLGLVGELVDGAISKFLELGAKIGEALGSLFGGGGEGGGFELDLSALDDAKVKIDEFKLALQTLPAIAAVAATAFVTGFAAVLIVQTTLLTQTFLLLWQTAILNFTLLLPLITVAWMSMSLILQTLTINMAMIISMLWLAMTTDMLMQTTLMISGVITQHTILLEAVLAATAAITLAYVELVSNAIAEFNSLMALFVEVMKSNEKLALQTREMMGIATAAVDGLAGAYKELGAAAQAAADAVVDANETIAASSAATEGEVTASPTLRIQHPFEKFEDYMKTANFMPNLDMVDALGGMFGMLNSILVPQSTGNTSSVVNNNMNIGQINGSQGDENGANILFDRWLALKERR